MSISRLLILTVLASVPATIAFAADGVLIAQKTTTGTSTSTTEIQVERSRMRAEATVNGEQQVIVFDGAAQVAYIIMPAKKSYMELTKAQVDQMGGMMQGMMAQMQAQMANLPPEQRAQMEGMMRGRGMGMAMGGGAAERTSYKRTGTDRVGKWACDTYEGYRNGQKVSELCTASPTVLGFTAADFAVTEQLAAFIGGLLPEAGEQVSAIGRGGADGYTGFPIRSVVTSMGRTTTSEVTDIRRQTFADSVFAVPQGFQKQSMFGR